MALTSAIDILTERQRRGDGQGRATADADVAAAARSLLLPYDARPAVTATAAGVPAVALVVRVVPQCGGAARRLRKRGRDADADADADADTDADAVALDSDVNTAAACQCGAWPSMQHTDSGSEHGSCGPDSERRTEPESDDWAYSAWPQQLVTPSATPHSPRSTDDALAGCFDLNECQ
jgi:hypothetical protein